MSRAVAYSFTNSSGTQFFLHSKRVTLRGGKEQPIYFFAKEVRSADAVSYLPDGYEVWENLRNGFPTLRRRPLTGESSGDGGRAEIVIEPGADELTVSLVGDDNLGVKLPTGEILRVDPRAYVAAGGVARAVDTLESLLADPTTSELTYQRLLEENPEILLLDEYVEARPQISLTPNDSTLIPDFLLRPVGHDLWDILELKRPSATVLTTRGGRPQFTREVAAAVAQLRSYAEAVDDPAVRDRLEARYGIRMFRPQLHLVVGRLVPLDRVALKRASDPFIRVVGWDELVMRARRRFR
ncbi:Shedu anti-phage system protein SduA domain-containing protein [Asanoa sp. NPDC049573]|uniref:Shedu anti-phage system protein SduA domain-containing protein n=1 Tax=Asanoa sp. NPDC049573 TaxID=3155396 RepID=UPI0034176E7D